MRRTIQYHNDGNLWEYTIDGEQCGCGCNVFHHEYDKPQNKVFIVCNACDDIIAEIKREYTHEELSKGIWKWKLEIHKENDMKEERIFIDIIELDDGSRLYTVGGGIKDNG